MRKHLQHLHERLRPWADPEQHSKRFMWWCLLGDLAYGRELSRADFVFWLRTLVS